MATVATTIRIPNQLQERYDRLAQSTGRTRNYLMHEALERYIAGEEWQLGETRATLAKLDTGELDLVPAEELMARYLAEGKVTKQGLEAAEKQYGELP